ncbi:MAG: 2-amino-4-hydroxy-6-hydroxymethyldihydropteridine diphosphokinase [Muribaculaceae bacterium]
MNSVVVSIGSNSADRDKQMATCIAWLNENFDVTKISSVYNSPAANGKDPDYLNAVAEIQTALEHGTLNNLLKDYERNCGRTPHSKVLGSIPIDIDIVMWNGDVLRQKDFSQPYFSKGWQEITK